VITAAAPADADVVQRELVSAVNGEVVSTTVWAGTAVDLGTLSAEQDAQVSLSLVDIDDAGNRSMPATVTFVAADTIPPSAPGGLGVMLVGETRTDS
jgi:predicted anti-sigma-YlaC factor YlaD